MSLHRKSVLLIEPYPPLLESLAELLRLEGFEVFGVCSEEAGRALQSAHAVDLVIADRSELATEDTFEILRIRNGTRIALRKPFCADELLGAIDRLL